MQFQRLFPVFTVLPFLLMAFACTPPPPASVANIGFPVEPLDAVPAVRQRPEWNRFVILVWQWQNDVRRDGPLYDLAGLHGFHIDRGAGRDDLVRLSLERQFPYYVDHAAGKGILYLNSSLRPQVTGKRSLLVRPHSLADPVSIASLKNQLQENISSAKAGLVYAYAFDDEISLGSFNTPAEVDVHPLSLAWYRKWLGARYGTIQRLNESWHTGFPSFEAVQPTGFEEVRRSASAPPIARWNLSHWMEWRHFMDYQFARVLAGLTRYANTLDPAIPAGFVGGQQPSAYGGYDYALLSRAVQWMEGYDEILRSFWNRPRRPHIQTYHLTGSVGIDTWALWQRLAHGNQATVAWPEGWMREKTVSGERELAPKVQALSAAFQEIQGGVSEFIVNPESFLDTDPIGIYYSHPSIRAGWVMDVIPHGASWPNRSSSIDDDNLSPGWLLQSWGRLLEDLGYQYEHVSYLDVQEGRCDLSEQYKIIILPQIICLSETEARALRRFVEDGGTLIADHLCGLLTESGRGWERGILDDLFGVARDEPKGYLNGRALSEINAEYYDQPFPNRLGVHKGAIVHGAMTVFERGTRANAGANAVTSASAQVLIKNRTGRGQSIYLNLTPLAYDYFPFRSAAMGQQWRDTVGAILRESGLKPRIEAEEAGGGEPWLETLLWRNGDRYCLVVLKNPSRDPADVLKDILGGDSKLIRIRINLPALDIVNLRTGRKFAEATSFTDELKSSEANLYSFRVAR